MLFRGQRRVSNVFFKLLLHSGVQLFVSTDAKPKFGILHFTALNLMLNCVKGKKKKKFQI